MGDQVKDEVELDFNVNEGDGVRKLQQLAGATERLGSIYERVTSFMMAAGGIGGVLAIGSSLVGMQDTYKQISRIRAITGMAAEEAHGMLDAFEMSGVEASVAERVMLSMTKQASKLSGELGGAGKGAETLAQQFSKLGVNLKDGPIQAIEQLAQATKEGKVNSESLVRMFGVPRTQAADMLKMLKQGPDAIRKIREETMGSADVINEAALAHFEAMQKARREAKDAWEGIVGVLYRQLLPVMSRFMTQMKEGFDDISPIVESIGKVLVEHMETAVSLAKTFAKLMLASKISTMVTGQGLTGHAKRAGNWVVGGALADGGAKSLSAIQGVQAFRVLGLGLARLTVIGGIILIIVKAFELLMKNSNGIRTAIGNMLGEIMAKFAKIGQAMTPVMEVLTKVITFVATALLDVFVAVLTIVNTILSLAQMIGIMFAMIVEDPSQLLSPFDLMERAYTEAQKQHEEDRISDEIRRARQAAKQPTPSDRGGSIINQDFRGSKFEIKQQFAEGFDPGRVSVTVGNDLAELGERSTMSNLSPLFAGR